MQSFTQSEELLREQPASLGATSSSTPGSAAQRASVCPSVALALGKPRSWEGAKSSWEGSWSRWGSAEPAPYFGARALTADAPFPKPHSLRVFLTPSHNRFVLNPKCVLGERVLLVPEVWQLNQALGQISCLGVLRGGQAFISSVVESQNSLGWKIIQFQPPALGRNTSDRPGCPKPHSEKLFVYSQTQAQLCLKLQGRLSVPAFGGGFPI